MKKITFKSKSNAVKWIIGEFKKELKKRMESPAASYEPRFAICLENDLERLSFINEFAENGVKLLSLDSGEEGFLFLSNVGISTHDSYDWNKKYDMIAVHSAGKLMKKTINLLSDYSKRIIRFNYEEEEAEYQKFVEANKIKKSEMSVKEKIELPDGFKVREDGHGFTYSNDTDNSAVRYSFYTSDDLSADDLKKMADRIVNDML